MEFGLYRFQLDCGYIRADPENGASVSVASTVLTLLSDDAWNEGQSVRTL